MTLDTTKTQALTDAQLRDVRVAIDVTVGGNDVGTITLELWPQAAPKTVRNFLRYASEGFYNGIAFHRVVKGFMIQGGCPLGTGTGNGTHGTIPGEFSNAAEFSHKRGVISMARTSDPNSASCQFFICHGDAEFLDGQYAAFGRMVDGDAALDAVGSVGTTMSGGEKSKPTEKVVIKSMTVNLGA
ncbi:MAG TPA: peptidylprolyl isomerase [Planctomycetota bacterium]